MRNNLGYPVDVYIGAFVNGHKQGYGEMFYVNGAMYVGYWSSDSFFGKGTLIDENGKEKSGVWHKEGLMTSEGQIHGGGDSLTMEPKSKCCF